MQRRAAVACKTLYLDKKGNNCIHNQSSSLTVQEAESNSEIRGITSDATLRKTHNNKLQDKHLILRKEDLRMITHGRKPMTVTAKPSHWQRGRRTTNHPWNRNPSGGDSGSNFGRHSLATAPETIPDTSMQGLRTVSWIHHYPGTIVDRTAEASGQVFQRPRKCKTRSSLSTETQMEALAETGE